MMERAVRNALEQELARVNWTELDTMRVMRRVQSMEREQPHRVPALRGRRLLAVVLAALLVLASVTAVAVSSAFSRMSGTVAQLEAEGELWNDGWSLESKLRFITAMRDAELEMDENDWAMLCDDAQDESARMAAADRIIDARYGDLMREEVAYWLQKPDTVVGMAPDIGIIFKEQWLREHPDCDLETVSKTQAYQDAYYRFLRDEYYPQVQAALEPEEPLTGTEAIAQWLRDDMTELFGWDWQAVEAMEPTLVWDEEYQLWTVSGTVPAASMEQAFDPVTESRWIHRTENGDYGLTILVSADGEDQSFDLDKAAFRKELDEAIPSAITNAEAVEMAKEAIMAQYGLTELDMKRYFDHNGEGWKVVDNEYHVEIRFLNHFNVWSDYAYGAEVNITTGELLRVWQAPTP